MHTTRNRMIREADLQQIGLFAKPHGVKGEIALITDYDIADFCGDPYLVCDIDGIWVPFFIQSFRYKGASTTLVTFENMDSADKVKFLTGKKALIPSEQMRSEDERPFLWSDSIGYAIVDERLGALGYVKDVDDSTQNILLKVDGIGHEILIPIALITSIAFNEIIMYTDLPEGFLDL